MEKEQIMKELENVIDPEIGVPITEMGLVDNITIEDQKISIDYHLTMPFCPDVFALQIGQDIKKRVSGLEGAVEVKVTLKDHVHAEEINKKINQ